MLDKYIFAEPADGKRLFILCTDPPFLIAEVVKGAEPHRVNSKCPGYRVFIAHYAHLDYLAIGEQEKEPQNLKEQLKDMALWYYDNRIHRSPTKFHKYKD